MSCGRFESMIALDVEGDLPARQATRLAEHLKSCAGCRQFAEEMRESLALLKSLKLETPPVSVVTEVRWRKPGRTPRWPWLRWAPLAVTAGLLLAVMAPLISHRPELAQPKLEIVRAEVPSPKLPVVRAKAPVPARRHAPKREPLLVKLVTNDPEVVIYWLVDQKGD